ncbi:MULTISPECIES: formimidoylglutamate deiminase [unclassified Variovorax]|uniref:formimidoylglutamate deiminase n=1 Tax=unclassified Variovorax TaxID=663243 RepID=UPI00076C8787|nr:MULTISPECIES: formimidoylglutamate deiminase [unclassified Variovorax]KWT64034.1 Formiminoglutamic iminohydrolase [Variovorax sp. WDL1]PNG58990.1 8-oxoguanine deaminase [Variovorax sp. B4]PNG61220.1 8-oxoguanine deaminase [Variovorax sp. B2]VTV12807.1 8-oxoguanine deaminase [Variovorax sp. WDL1]
MSKPGALHACDALLPSGWARNVLLRWDASGRLTLVQPDAEAQADAPLSAGPIIPGIPNLHSHAFQRAFAGLTEFRGTGEDSFWSWRTLMYRFAAQLSPAQVEAIATWLYVEMLEAGYTSVCEFHYLHHDRDGRPYADDAELALALLRAAERTGIGLTLLPVLYQASGFGGQPPNAGQRRFVRSTESMLRLLDRLRPLCESQGARLGLAPHSLRAVAPQALHEALSGLDAIDATAPVHIHIAEQTAEVEACLAWSGQRPVAWLLDHAPVDARWCLVHATHMDAGEYRGAAASGAVAGLCPTTEANLGDGLFDFGAWRAHGGRWGVGSDSHACVNAAEELLMLEYGQRLATRQRNIGADGAEPCVATAMTLAAVQGGAQAAGRAVAGLAVGQQADFVMLDANQLALAGLCPTDMLSSHVFASHRTNAIASACVAGQERVSGGSHPLHHDAAAAFVAARNQLLTASP